MCLKQRTSPFFRVKLYSCSGQSGFDLLNSSACTSNSSNIVLFSEALSLVIVKTAWVIRRESAVSNSFSARYSLE
jgi:hypothetical protein